MPYVVGLFGEVRLPDWFTFVTFAQNVGVEKPFPEMFLKACEQARCNPEQLMHIGDSLETDVIGANGVAAVSIWLNRSQRGKKLDIRRDYKIHIPVDLMDILAVEYELTSQTKNDQ